MMEKQCEKNEVVPRGGIEPPTRGFSVLGPPFPALSPICLFAPNTLFSERPLVTHSP